MGTRRMRIHVSHAGDPILLPDLDKLIKLKAVRDISLGEVLDVGPVLILSNLQVGLADIQEVAYFLHINFEDGDFELELHVVGRFLDGVEQILDLTNHPSTIRGMMPFASRSFKS